MSQAPFGFTQDRFSCPICLELLKEPVTIPCGHSYCMACLTNYWDQGPQTCSCPQCRATFNPRPALGKNTLLAEMLERFGGTSLSDGPSAPPAPPGMLSGYGGFEHAVFDVSSVQPEGNDGERLLGDTRRQLAQRIQEKESQMQELKQTLKSFSRLARAAVKDSSKTFTELLEFVERRRSEMKELIRAHERAEVTRAEAELQRLERDLSELKGKEAELQRLGQSQDPSLIAQVCQVHSRPACMGEAGALTVNTHISFGPLRKAISDLKEHLEALYQGEFQTIAHVVKNVIILKIGNSGEGVEVHQAAPALDNREDLIQYFCPLSLDPFTAHRELSLTESNRRVSRRGELHPYPDHPDRFDSWGQALCREGLEGRRYWEAEWEGLQVELGLTYDSIGRKGSARECGLGRNSVSWSLRCNASSFEYCHGTQIQPIAAPQGARSCRIGVFLDHSEGLMCFYVVTNGTVQLLHQVRATFTQPLYPAVWLGTNSCITFCSLN